MFIYRSVLDRALFYKESNDKSQSYFLYFNIELRLRFFFNGALYCNADIDTVGCSLGVALPNIHTV